MMQPMLVDCHLDKRCVLVCVQTLHVFFCLTEHCLQSWCGIRIGLEQRPVSCLQPLAS